MDGGCIDLRELIKVLAEETPAFDAYRRGDPDAPALWIAAMVRVGGRADHPNSLPE